MSKAKAKIEEGKQVEVAEKPAKVGKSERVTLFSKGKFTLFCVGGEHLIEDAAGRVISRPSTEEEGTKLVQDLNR